MEKLAFRFIFSLFLFIGSLAVAQEFQLYETADLGDGNRDLVNMYSAYFKKGVRYSATSAQNKPRLLITGFGRYGNLPTNISGAIIRSAMSLKNLPMQINRSQAWTGGNSRLPIGIVQSSTGVESLQRDIRIDGKIYNVCFLITNVTWDFSAAVIATEMHSYQPNRAILFGLGPNDDIILERGANNRADSISGYDKNGVALKRNTPIQSTLFPGLPSTLSLTMNRQRATHALVPMSRSMGISIEIPVSTSEDYICNQVAYTAAAVARGLDLPFANGMLTLRPRMNQKVDVGFIHLPPKPDSTQAWMRLLVDLIADY